MRLVPRQLRRSGMTGNVPYYGGRLTPDQVYAIEHPPGAPAAPAPGPPPERRTSASPDDQLAALQHLLDTGAITPEEHRQLSARLTS